MVAFFLVSCKKDDIQPPAKQKPQTMDELVASQNFNWKTTKVYYFNLSGGNDGIVKILSADGNVYHKGFMRANTNYSIKVTLPSYEKSVRLVYWGNDINCLLSQTSISYSFTIK